MEREKKLREGRTVKSEGRTEEDKAFVKSVKRRVDQSPRNTRRNFNRKQLFTPESAMSALPSLCISTVAARGTVAQEKKKYLDEMVRKEKLNKTKGKTIVPAKRVNTQSMLKKPQSDQLNISISERADECEGKLVKKSKGHKNSNIMVEENLAKHTVYSNDPRSLDLVIFLLPPI